MDWRSPSLFGSIFQPVSSWHDISMHFIKNEKIITPCFDSDWHISK